MDNDFEKKLLSAAVATSLLASSCSGIAKASSEEESSRIPTVEVNPSISTQYSMFENRATVLEKETLESEPSSTVELNHYVSEILESTPELSFDENGSLLFKKNGEYIPVALLETERYEYFPYKKMFDVKFFIIHYDGSARILSTGEKSTVINTLNGLNGYPVRNPSVHYLVDSFPVNDEPGRGNGFGIVESQRQSDDPNLPFMGRHVSIGTDETGRADITRKDTVNLFKKYGINSELIDFVKNDNKYFDGYSLGVEQTGNADVFSMLTKEQYPEIQQIANTLALTRAVVSKYDLTVWDVIGHDEIQEKSDPGDEYMLTLRYLLALSYMTNSDGMPDDFLGGDTPREFFGKLRDYSIERMGIERYRNWNKVFGMDRFIYEMQKKFNNLYLSY